VRGTIGEAGDPSVTGAMAATADTTQGVMFMRAPIFPQLLHRLVAGACLSLLVCASPATVGEESAAQVPAQVEKTLREKLFMPSIGLGIETVERSEIDGLYRVKLENGPVVYATPDGEFFVLGDMYTVGVSGLVNLGEQRRSRERLAAVEAVAEEDQIVFPAKGKTKAHMTVFTDASCFYCQKLHQEVPELNRRGVEIRYLAYPREGLSSVGFRQLATAWCADDRQRALTRLKNRENVPLNVCAGNPIAEQFELGQQVGVRGTPAIVLPDGRIVPGYKSAEDLIAILGIE
jgi:thiol:disulfide interchange protein DsbC